MIISCDVTSSSESRSEANRFFESAHGLYQQNRLVSRFLPQFRCLIGDHFVNFSGVTFFGKFAVFKLLVLSMLRIRSRLRTALLPTELVRIVLVISSFAPGNGSRTALLPIDRKLMIGGAGSL